MIDLKIVFFKKPEVYLPREVVDGYVLLETDEDIKARFFEICLHGEAHAHWTESESRSRSNSDGTSESYNETIYYSARKEYAHMSTKVWKSINGEKMKKGVYKFEFSFVLPLEVAPSFESLYGNIRYYIHVTLDRPWIWNKKCKKCFTVVPIVNLLSFPYAACPTEIAAAKKTGLIFKSGMLELKASVPKRGYVPGEIVPIQIQINNSSSKPVVDLSLKICQKIRCLGRRDTSFHVYNPMAHYKIKHQEKILEKHQEDMNISKYSKCYLTIPMRIPVTVSTFETCPVIQVTYFIRVKIENTEMFMSSVTCDIPLIIGTIPISVGEGQQEDTPPPYSMNDMPPSYEESMKAIEKEDFEPYSPLYPVFNNLPSAPVPERTETKNDFKKNPMRDGF